MISKISLTRTEESVSSKVMEKALVLIAQLLKTLLAIKGFSGAVEIVLHVQSDRQEVKIVPRVYP